MIDRFRALGAAAVAAALGVLSPAGVATQTPASTAPSPWRTGDVFAGVGRFDVRPGEYLVLDSQGRPKDPPQVLVDPTAGSTGMAIGCAVAPPAFGNAMYATTYFNRRVVRFDNTTGTPSVVASIAHPTVEAIESLVFDSLGHYYVGGMDPHAESALDPPPPFGYIFKFDTGHNLVATYQVPNEKRGVDWIDLGSDQKTLYYTSEGTSIHVFNPELPEQLRYRRIQIVDGGVDVQGTAYALRLLPPTPDDPATPAIENPNLEPGGFLVATNAGVLRVAPDGTVLRRYEPGVAGQFFALNITPDGQSFWTATFQRDPDWADYCEGGKYYDRRHPEWCQPEPRAGQLMKIHIPTGAVTAGPLDLGVSNVWGLCVMREYTAGTNTCYQTDGSGAAVLDANGNPISVPCRTPEHCDNGRDDDGDGLVDLRDRDCAVPGTPLLVPPPDRTNLDGDTIEPEQLLASDPDGDPLTFTASGLPPGISMSPSGLLSGSLSWNASKGSPYNVVVTVYDGVPGAAGVLWTRESFKWEITYRNGPPTLGNPGPVTVAMDRQNTIGLPVREPNYDSVGVTATGLPPGMSAPAVAGPGQLYDVDLTGQPLAEGSFPVSVCIRDLVPETIGRPVCQSFTITVVPTIPENHPPACALARPSSVLLEPNHKLVPVSIDGITDPDGQAVAITVTAIQQDEPVSGEGAGATVMDGRIDGATAWVRAERTGVKAAPGTGRVYEIFYTASDGIASCSGSVTVGIAHDLGQAGKPGQQAATDSGMRWDSLTGVRIR